MKRLPEIQSIGPPPEKHADRVIAEIMRFIVGVRAREWPDVEAIFTDPHASDGNPKAQAKLVKKIKAAAGECCLGAQLRPGKRGRYTVTSFFLSGWDPAEERLVTDPEAIPYQPWSALSAHRIERHGHRQVKWQHFPVLFITHHALSRLAQRCGARTAIEVYRAVQLIALEFLDNLLFEEASSNVLIRDNQRFRVKLPPPMGAAICVVRRDGEKTEFTITTLWGEEERP
jgi:hypothetical protein